MFVFAPALLDGQRESRRANTLQLVPPTVSVGGR
jgi:hypothetical protein